MPVVPDLVCVGHVVREMICFPNDVRGPFLGSPPAYCSVAAVRQGTSTGIVTKIGPDMPKELLKPIIEAGIDTAGIGMCGRTTATELIYDTNGNKEIRYPAKADPIKVGDIPKAYRGCRMIYVCVMDNDVLPEDLAEVVAVGQCSAVDLGGYGGVHMSKAHRESGVSLIDLAKRVSKHFKIVKVSDEDAKSIFGWDDPDASANKLLTWGPEIIVITLGAKGALVCTSEYDKFVPPLPVRAIDVTGGGDTFMAGFLSEYIRSADPVKAGQWGSATAACVIEKSGGVLAERMPDRQKVQEIFDKGYYIRAKNYFKQNLPK